MKRPDPKAKHKTVKEWILDEEETKKLKVKTERALKVKTEGNPATALGHE